MNVNQLDSLDVTTNRKIEIASDGTIQAVIEEHGRPKIVWGKPAVPSGTQDLRVPDYPGMNSGA
jgi:hypothetical protein